MKNNAIEKVENLTQNNTSDTKTENQNLSKKKNVKNSKTTNKSVYKPKNGDTRQSKEQKEELQNKRVRELNAQKKRDDKERKEKLKEQKRQEKLKAKKARKEAVNKKKQDYKAEKLRRREERKARRDILKHETKEEKRDRIAAQKQAKIRERQNIRAQKLKEKEALAAVKRQKLADKRALKEQKRNLRQQNRREKRSRGLGGWLAAVIALGTSTLILATLFTMSMFDFFASAPLSNNAEIAQSYYSFTDYVNNMDVAMSKLLVSNDTQYKQMLLNDLTVKATLAAEDITRLPLQDESKFYTTKFINQVADYSKYLSNRLIGGDSISDEDLKNLNNLYKINNALKEELSLLSKDMGSEFDFQTIYLEEGENIILERFNRLESMACDYPKLIYDGPFSDSIDKEEKADYEEISVSEAQNKFRTYFKDFDIKDIEIVGEAQGKINAYSIKANAADGEIYASIGKKSGELIMFNHYADCTENNYGIDECIKRAEDYLNEIGYHNMTAVWATESGATVYVNFCYVKGGVIIYPDMIKLTVCKQRGIVSALSSDAYYFNHKPRDIKEPLISQDSALTGLSTDLYVLSSRLCLIPKGNNEVLAYEFYGTKNEEEYYIYVDALTGKETQIFKVVSTLDGNLLI